MGSPRILNKSAVCGDLLLSWAKVGPCRLRVATEDNCLIREIQNGLLIKKETNVNRSIHCYERCFDLVSQDFRLWRPFCQERRHVTRMNCIRFLVSNAAISYWSSLCRCVVVSFQWAWISSVLAKSTTTVSCVVVSSLVSNELGYHLSSPNQLQPFLVHEEECQPKDRFILLSTQTWQKLQTRIAFQTRQKYWQSRFLITRLG